MRKLTLVLLVLTMAVSSAALYTGCTRAKAEGKLQIMYSGNIRGNVAPCG